ncbi:MAG TPA: SDR family NAD(P)-dependent oxidoreductase, partial [Acidobacteriaceae bacterium]
GEIINLSSVTAIMPEVLNGVYDGTKAFVLAFSLALHREFAGSNIRVQAVLPGLTTTDFWNTAGTPLDQPSELLMKPDDVVDAALAGFDQGELVTIPSLPDIADWEAYEAARQNLFPKLSLISPAAHYGVAALNSFGSR